MACLFGNIALIFVSSSFYEAFKYLSFFFIVLFLKIFYQTKFYRHTKIGIYICLVGMVIISISTNFFDIYSNSNFPCNFINFYNFKSTKLIMRTLMKIKMEIKITLFYF
jgi:drug/metabolite transporter (DMT)-like permease